MINALSLSYAERNNQIVRQAIRELNDADEADRSEIAAEIIRYFSRSGDTEMVRNKAKSRYAYGIETEEKVTGGFTHEFEVYKRGKEAAKFDNGFYPMISTGIGPQLVSKIATLFTEPDQNWDWVRDSKGGGEQQSVEEISGLMGEVRKRGGFSGVIQRADTYSVAIESCAVHAYYSGEEIQYDVVPPGSVWFKFGSQVRVLRDGKKPYQRGVNYSDINDASAVVIRLSSRKGDKSTTPDESQYLAYVGQCEGDYTDGRMVTYEAREWWPIPDVGAKNITAEYRHDETGRPCNPLTYVLKYGGPLADLVTTEYPLVVLRGGLCLDDGMVMPITESLFSDCIEIDVAWSKLLKDALQLPMGHHIFKHIDTIKGMLPRSLDVMVLPEGLEYDLKHEPAANLQTAMDFVKVLVQQISSGFNVPGYMIVASIGGAATVPESGISLAIQTQPLIDFRRQRRNLNEHAIEELYHIEAGLLAEYYPDLASKLVGVKQIWNPGTWKVPEAEVDRIAGIVAARDADLIDHIDALRRYHRLPTRKEAEKKFDDYVAGPDEDYKKATSNEGQTGGLGGLFGGGQNV